MNWETAKLILAGKVYKSTDEDRSAAIAFIANALHSTGSGEELCDWIAAGEWNGSETLDEVQAELNAIEMQAAV